VNNVIMINNVANFEASALTVPADAVKIRPSKITSFLKSAKPLVKKTSNAK